MEIELQWGLNPIPENAIAAWGARAILKQQCLDLLWDRQSFDQGKLSDLEKDRFVNWINKSGLPNLRKHIVKNRWKNDSEEVFELNDKSYHLRASCKCSYGYCYISAWQEQPEQNQALSTIKE